MFPYSCVCIEKGQFRDLLAFCFLPDVMGTRWGEGVTGVLSDGPSALQPFTHAGTNPLVNFTALGLPWLSQRRTHSKGIKNTHLQVTVEIKAPILQVTHCNTAWHKALRKLPSRCARHMSCTCLNVGFIIYKWGSWYLPHRVAEKIERNVNLPAWCLEHRKCFMGVILRNVGYLSVVTKNRCEHLKFSSNVVRAGFIVTCAITQGPVLRRARRLV